MIDFLESHSATNYDATQAPWDADRKLFKLFNESYMLYDSSFQQFDEDLVWITCTVS